jgi:hypothetical protein
MKDGAELDTYSPSGDERKVKSSICQRVGDMQFGAYRRWKIQVKQPFHVCNY